MLKYKSLDNNQKSEDVKQDNKQSNDKDIKIAELDKQIRAAQRQKYINRAELSAAVMCWLPSNILLCCHQTQQMPEGPLHCCYPGAECGDTACCCPEQRTWCDFFCKPTGTIQNRCTENDKLNEEIESLNQQLNTIKKPPAKQTMS